jgi:preprotein translocase subunit SecA
MSERRLAWNPAPPLLQAARLDHRLADPKVASRADLWLSARWGAASQRLPMRLARLKAAADQVLAREDMLRPQADAALKAQVAELRNQLHRHGLTADQIPPALALAREAARRSLGLHAYPEQVMGAIALLNGMVAEMATGEGKTLTAGLAAACAALTGRAVHVVTVNDYLAERDADLLGPLFEFFGLDVGVTRPGQTPTQRRAAYACALTYCTNKDLVFDHLRDRIADGLSASPRRTRVRALLGRGQARPSLVDDLAFAIVDEADSVLIDEARTPLIISSERDRADPALYHDALRLGRELVPDEHCLLDLQRRQVQLTTAGRDKLAALRSERGLAGLWASERAREQLCCQALSALHLFSRDRDYIVRDGKVQIVDEYTGRVLADRSWERGLHQMVEAKEQVELTPNREAVARLTYQRFFTRYALLAGMSGTAREVAGELWAVYGLPVVGIPTHRPLRRSLLGRRVFSDDTARWQALVERCATLQQASRAVLIGTRSVQTSEAVAAHLARAGLEAVVLNAKQDADEAAVVAQAGQPGRITVATNMAGRGTDIVLAPQVRDAGGLHVVLTEFHESARIDRQLFGRCARQGDPGSCEAMACVHDDLFARFAPRLRIWVLRAARSANALPAALAAVLARWAQWRAERAHAQVRMDTVQQDARLARMMSFTGRKE